MLDTKYKDAYNSICVPDDMLCNIKGKISKKRHFNYKKLISVAACILLIAIILPTYINLSNPEVAVTNNGITVARSVDKRIYLTLEAKRQTSVSVSSGDIGISSDKKLKGTIELVWSISPTDSEPYVLTLKDIFGTRNYTLSYNENNDSWTIIEK